VLDVCTLNKEQYYAEVVLVEIVEINNNNNIIINMSLVTVSIPEGSTDVNPLPPPDIQAHEPLNNAK